MSVIDTATNTVTATIPVGSGPTAVAVSPDGSLAYVTNIGDGTVSVISIGAITSPPTPWRPIGSAPPHGLASAPTAEPAAARQQGVTVTVVGIDTATDAVTHVVPWAAARTGGGLTPPAHTPATRTTRPDGSEIITVTNAAQHHTVLRTDRGWRYQTVDGESPSGHQLRACFPVSGSAAVEFADTSHRVRLHFGVEQ